MKLVIAEKPSVAQSLAAVIGATARKDGYLEGGGWRVSWCVGHLAGLADADAYNPDYAKWRYDDLPILPEPWQMVVSKDKKKQFDVLKQLMNAPDVTEVVNACDAGREGELIFRSVYELAGCQKPMKRLWISSMEDSAIREGFENLRPGADYDGLRDAALRISYGSQSDILLYVLRAEAEKAVREPARCRFCGYRSEHRAAGFSVGGVELFRSRKI